MAVTIMQEFNTDAYNAVCLFSSCLGIFGAIYQILPRQEFSNKHRWLSFSAERGRKIIVWLAVADLLASLGVFARSTIWINYKNIMPAVEDDSSVVFCAISSVSVLQCFPSVEISFPGFDPILLHRYLDLDSHLRHRHEIYPEGTGVPNYVLSSSGVDPTRNTDHDRVVPSLPTRCQLPHFYVFRNRNSSNTAKLYCNLLAHNSCDDSKSVSVPPL
jgi:hypothetical protein